jgi:hypothetical protein
MPICRLSAKVIACIIPLCLSTALADDGSDFRGGVKWSIFHEGCRAYAADDNLGNITGMRQCINGTQRHNQHFEDLLGNANDAALLDAVKAAVADIPTEFDLRGAFQWVMYHEGQKEKIRVMLGQNDFEGIRTLYHDKQNHNPNARNLLAAVSNAYIRNLVNSL